MGYAVVLLVLCTVAVLWETRKWNRNRHLPLNTPMDYFNKAVIHAREKNYFEAIHIIEELLRRKDSLSPEVVCDAYMATGMFYCEWMKFGKAATFFDQAYALFDQIPQKPQIASLDEILRCYKRAGRPEACDKWDALIEKK